MSESSARSGGYLLLRRGGVLWGIDNTAVVGLTRQGETFRIRIGNIADSADLGGETALSADEILCVVDDLRVQPAAAALRRFWPGVAPSVTGLAVHGEQPLVIVDPRRPPELLGLDDGADIGDDGGDTDDGERE